VSVPPLSVSAAPSAPSAKALAAPKTHRRRRLITPLDRYVAGEFLRIFIVTLLGFPLLVSIIDLVDNLRKYTANKVSMVNVAWSYYYMLPDTMFMVLPAATLFATVFSIGGFTRYSEITAAKASGISFYRFIMPIIAMSFVAMALGLAVGEAAPPANAQRQLLLRGKSTTSEAERFNFAFASASGRVYRVYTLSVPARSMERVEIEQRRSAQQPGVLISAEQADYNTTRGWKLRHGVMHITRTDTSDAVVAFDSLYDPGLSETPQELRASDKAPTEMNFGQLSTFINALEKSGADVAALKVERMLKLAIPVTCVIIALFGAPLATSSHRGGAAYGVAVSLGTTIIFLLLIQLTKAIGGHGLVSADLAAWLPNILIGSIALILLVRVRT
jgi:lipopolysaccharide export system permease protein